MLFCSVYPRITPTRHFCRRWYFSVTFRAASGARGAAIDHWSLWGRIAESDNWLISLYDQPGKYQYSSTWRERGEGGDDEDKNIYPVFIKDRPITWYESPQLIVLDLSSEREGSRPEREWSRPVTTTTTNTCLTFQTSEGLISCKNKANVHLRMNIWIHSMSVLTGY